MCWLDFEKLKNNIITGSCNIIWVANFITHINVMQRTRLSMCRLQPNLYNFFWECISSLRHLQENVFDFCTDTLQCSIGLAKKDFVLLRRRRPEIKRAWRNFRLLRRRLLRNGRGEHSRTFSSAAAACLSARHLFINTYIYKHEQDNNII